VIIFHSDIFSRLILLKKKRHLFPKITNRRHANRRFSAALRNQSIWRFFLDSFASIARSPRNPINNTHMPVGPEPVVRRKPPIPSPFLFITCARWTGPVKSSKVECVLVIYTIDFLKNFCYNLKKDFFRMRRLDNHKNFWYNIIDTIEKEI
jgi:hypothetical protein